MTLRILASLILGILAGLLFLSDVNVDVVGELTNMALALLLFTVGFELGQDTQLKQKLKDLPKMALGVPFLIAIGSLIGAMLAGLVLNRPFSDAMLVGAGFGWYSLSGVIIAQTYDVTLGALALLTNVLREVFAIAVIPILAKRLSYISAVAPGGATTMDVTLPLVAKNTDTQTTLIAFYSGTVLSILVPIVVPLLIQIFNT